MKKMRVHSSNLALRFYAKEGWTLELLNSLCTNGRVVKHPHFEKDEKLPQYGGGYFIPEVGTMMDIPELMKYVSEVIRAFDDRPDETDEQFVARHLWQ